MKTNTFLAVACCLTVASTLLPAAPAMPMAESPPSGGFVNPGAVAPIAAPPDVAPMFRQWQVGNREQPIACRFSACPNTPYQIFVGLNEAHWDKPGQRMMDLEIGGKIVTTVDAFHQAKNTPSGYLFAATADAEGHLSVRVLPHPGAPDTNTVVCGVSLFGANEKLDADAIIHDREPKPIISVVAGQAEPPRDHFATARFVNHRVDNDLVAGMGTCFLDDFRFFTMLHQDAWDQLRWESLGNAVMDHRTWRNWPYEQHLHVQVDGVELTEDSARVEQVEQQFDFRMVSVSSPSLQIERLDLMRSARQWTTALHLTNGVDSVTNQWPDLLKLCEARRHYLYDRMPRLTGFDSDWDGMWSYAFDLMRSAIQPAQANFKDVWMVTSFDVYREPFYWDGPATMHTFCNWDADLAARMMRTFWSSMQPDGTVCVSANPYRPYNNPTPQLANLTMALWDCYQITRDKAMLASFYPQIVKHVRWLETKRNRTPNGPLMEVGYNIDYGCAPSLYASPTIWPDVQFFLVDRYRHLAKIAAVLGQPQAEVDEWSAKADRLAEGIRKHMWDDKAGTFWCVSDKLELNAVYVMFLKNASDLAIIATIVPRTTLTKLH